MYTGITIDVNRRFEEHQANKGARYLRGKGPLELVFSMKVGGKSLALRVEREIKKLSKIKKENLISSSCEVLNLIRQIDEK